MTASKKEAEEGLIIIAWWNISSIENLWSMP